MKNLLLFIVLVLSFAIANHASAEWTTKTPISSPRAYLDGVAYEDKIYLIGGGYMGRLSIVEVYDPATDIWTIKTPMPTARSSAAVAVLDGKIYVAGGYGASTRLDTFEIYDITSDTWTTGPPMPRVRNGAAAEAVNGKIYVLGGKDNYSNHFTIVDVYDPVTNLWSTNNGLIHSRVYAFGCEVVNNKIYIIGGRYTEPDNTEVTTVEVYDPVTDTSEIKAPMPTARGGVGASLLNGKIYMAGGFTLTPLGYVYLDTLEAYDVANNTWEAIDDPMPTVRTVGVAATIGDSIYFIGGENGAITYDIVEEYSVNNTPVVTLTPLILIPGIGGSWEKNGVMMLDPILHTYDYLAEALTNNGYTLDENLFLFPYDWRRSNNETAIDLKLLINDIASSTGTEKVDIVAHSMGGLVARRYIQGDNYEDDVDQLIFLNTPHTGAPKSYLINEGGYFKGISDNILKYILTKEAWSSGKSLLSYIQDDITSVSELLPTYDYLMDKQGNDWQSRIYPSNYPVNSFIDELNLNIEVVAARTLVTNIYSDPIADSTLRYIHTMSNPFKYGDKWEYGYPKCLHLSNDDCLVMREGDTTVPIDSLTALPGADTVTISDSAHRSIVTKSQQEVIEILIGTSTSEYYEASWGDITSALLAFTMCPVDIVLTTPSGERVGKNFATSGEVNEVAGAFYAGFNGLHEFSTIINPISGSYELHVQGTGEGIYQLGINVLTDETLSGPDDDLITGIIKENEIHNLYFQINEAKKINELYRDIDFENIRADIKSLRDSGDIKKHLIKKWLIRSINHLEKKYQRWENTNNNRKKARLKKQINWHIWLIKKQIKFYNNKNWITDEAYQVLDFDLKSLRQVIWQ